MVISPSDPSQALPTRSLTEQGRYGLLRAPETFWKVLCLTSGVQTSEFLNLGQLGWWEGRTLGWISPLRAGWSSFSRGRTLLGSAFPPVRWVVGLGE